ncbi:double zinc ribbon domain-containing protein [Geobacter benzoatilyticus]|uniref:Zinc ribbon domain-containing protein n=1 Tax=Geobacter benzoatilyticus TaxID=2815309 RepID=A0ABX7Q749_9BACT|nr:zinc ribbon domain-containing protein [Geobacter benzoatilyticus]QSV46895.1 zinc ribbon domain-containing protein [Geobacter benzoatilyticus]
MGFIDSLKSVAKTVWEGDPNAGYEAGMRYVNENDFNLASHFLEDAAKRGHVDAQYSLGYLYWDGKLTSRDMAKAQHWLSAAAQNGHIDAQYLLGYIFHEGQVVPRDMAKAQYWLTMAAQQGHQDALAFIREQEAANAPAPVTPGISCTGCGAAMVEGARFCPECGEKAPLPKCCPSCGAPQTGPAKFCPECGANLNAPPKCSGCGAEMAPEAKFCGDCGTKAGATAPNPTATAPQRNDAPESITLEIAGPGMEVSCGRLSDEQYEEILQLQKDGEFENSDYCECTHNYNDVFHLYGVLSSQDGDEIRSPKLAPNYEEVDTYSEFEDGIYIIYAAPSRKTYGSFTINCPGGFVPEKLSIQLSTFDISMLELDDEGTELMGSIISGISYDDEPIDLEFEDNGGDCCRFIVRIDDGCWDIIYSQRGEESEWNS